jgi:predicted metal-dependent enzyme (double-stranded beta helix superfamily)
MPTPSATATLDAPVVPLPDAGLLPSGCPVGGNGLQDRLQAVARTWATRPAWWAEAVRHRPAERAYTPLAASPELSVWLITWPPGTGLGLHDHGGSAGALAVVGGELTEWYGDVRAFDADAPDLRQRRLVTGSVVGFSPVHLHEVRNLGKVPATSIHVYAPRLDTMAFYGAADPGLPPVDGTVAR